MTRIAAKNPRRRKSVATAHVIKTYPRGKTRSGLTGRKKRARFTAPAPRPRVVDAQLAEFERRDLGDDMRAAGTARVIWPRARATSIVLEPALIDALRRKGAKRGLGYQTMLKVIVREHLDEY
jgi:predicted DNA binding CopG/RHH family protein